MAYNNVYNPRGSLTRQYWYAMRHCLRKGRWLFKTKTVDAAGRGPTYYTNEALCIVRKLPCTGNQAFY